MSKQKNLLYIHAKDEIDVYLKENKGKNTVLEKYLPSILEIVKVFSTKEHIGSSAGYEINEITTLLQKLLSYEPITPITGNKDEWEHISDKTYQNIKNSCIFKDLNKNKQAYYLDAIIWKDQNEQIHSGTVEGVTSRQFIKKFPFIPKSFYVDVVGTESSKHPDTYYTIKDVTQLEEVFKYYDENKTKRK